MSAELAWCLTWARALVSACEDFGIEKSVAGHEAAAALRDVEGLPRVSNAFGASWLRCRCGTLREYIKQAERCGRHVNARAYAACIAVRMLAAEAAEMTAKT